MSSNSNLNDATPRARGVLNPRVLAVATVGSDKGSVDHAVHSGDEDALRCVDRETPPLVSDGSHPAEGECERGLDVEVSEGRVGVDVGSEALVAAHALVPGLLHGVVTAAAASGLALPATSGQPALADFA